MNDVTIWHNPRCSKSRETLALLQGRGITPVEIHYLSNPRNEEEIRLALAALGAKPIDMMRINDAKFSDLGLSSNSDEDTLIAAMVENPGLIERPIVFANSKAAIGRPPEAVLSLF